MYLDTLKSALRLIGMYVYTEKGNLSGANGSWSKCADRKIKCNILQDNRESWASHKNET